MHGWSGVEEIAGRKETLKARSRRRAVRQLPAARTRQQMGKLQDTVHAESLKDVSTIAEKHDEQLHVDPVEERRIVRKLDFCLIPIMALFYLLSFLVHLLLFRKWLS